MSSQGFPLLQQFSADRVKASMQLMGLPPAEVLIEAPFEVQEQVRAYVEVDAAWDHVALSTKKAWTTDLRVARQQKALQQYVSRMKR